MRKSLDLHAVYMAIDTYTHNTSTDQSEAGTTKISKPLLGISPSIQM
jgi:hypothetical protein